MQAQYKEILQAYLEGRGETQLYLAQQLGKWFLKQNVAPEEIIDMHLHTMEEMVDMPEPVRESFQLLTEVMIEYGNTYREHRSLRSRQKQLESEIEVAVTMQQTLLSEKVPSLEGVDIGLVSVPAKKMSGDYYHFVRHDADLFSVAIADITGKGIPAALCMSMIKYAMDCLYLTRLDPSEILFFLNGIVERNIDPSMFVTMLCGCYCLESHHFRYAVAGHEPGFLYRAKEETFYDLAGQGIALGVKRGAKYPEYSIGLEEGDLLILLTDGVTERKMGERFLQREELIGYLQAEVGRSAQEIADNLYRRLLELSHFELPDDHTMIVIRRA
ncbi:PP2C family protein-serine/threonine phosphatase [Brevibacillus sp. SYP-B805]|uniref:PP2C family protein-serine/threonine phosphatase n=1 Tax=Brevibacillus sp. SYP-B805 TaxID=1578199 RepID=UPI001F49A705|nr:PP2C family protein-serine/threonine phosphatase [Brevibacillus sp. SYP-B805]